MTKSTSHPQSRSIQETAHQPLLPELLRFIRPTLPSLDNVMTRYVAAYGRGAITNGDIVSNLEAEVADRLGVPHCVAVSSCTSGLMLVLRALDLKGEVILPSFTFFASAHAIAWNGLTPVLADCDPDRWTIDPDDVERRITPQTSAVVAVHMYGNPCEVDRLQEICNHHGLKLIFDAAHAFGSRCGAKKVGQFGDAEVFSLSPTKLLVAGEGGLVTTSDGTLARRLRAARNYGDLGAYDPEVLGLNARMTEFNAALALAGLDLVPAKVRRHNAIAAEYTRALVSIPGLSFQFVAPESTSTYKDYSVLVEPDRFGCTRDELAAALRRENIDTKRYFYPPVHQQTLYARYAKVEDPLWETERVANQVLSLPIYASLPDETVTAICTAIADYADEPVRVRTVGAGAL